jgi:Domain of unknown function (DUF4410)
MNRVCAYRSAASLVVGFLGLAGCASTVPKATFSHEIANNARVAATDQADVRVDAADGIKILPSETQRLSEKIKAKIDSRKVANSVDQDGPRNYEIDLHLTRYDKGNAFARAMLAGLGQIHIDGTVSVYRMPEHTLVGQFQLAKTFAWGGIYGAATSMEDIENTFADGVAASVTGQKEEPTKQKKT